MLSLYAVWSGLIKYKNPLMPLIHSTATFEVGEAGGFNGIINEEVVVLPDGFEVAFEDFDVPLHPNGEPYGFQVGNNVSSVIMMGEFPDIVYPQWGLAINFVKMPDQLTGYPVFYKGAFNAAADKIVGTWQIVEGDTPCHLPLNMKQGHFTFSKPRGHPKIAPPKETPVSPSLLPA